MKFSLCNEVLHPLPFAEQCRIASALGYAGLEVAPFTLAEDPSTITDPQALEFKRIADDHGIAISGLHWLLVAPPGLSIVSDDAQVRQRTAAFMQRLVELCAAMGGNYLVHGSPKQRKVPEGATREQAWERARECLAQAALRARECGVTYCIEPLSTRETDLLNTVEEAVKMVKEIASPAFKTMIDCSAAGQTESLAVHQLISNWMTTDFIGHIQVNDPNRRGPGQGDLAFGPILSALRMWSGWVAVEPFDYVPDGPGAAAHAIGYLRGVLEGLRHGH
jgi:D-psicose/D-tagatose/L-ribulose 3-epimerase